MSMESDLSALLLTVCPRVFPDVAPNGTDYPFVVWHQLGGEALRFGDNTAPDKRNALVQVNVWSKTRLEALNMIRQIEDAICDSTAWQARPEGEAVSLYEQDADIRGCLQRFDIWATR